MTTHATIALVLLSRTRNQEYMQNAAAIRISGWPRGERSAVITENAAATVPATAYTGKKIKALNPRSMTADAGPTSAAFPPNKLAATAAFTTLIKPRTGMRFANGNSPKSCQAAYGSNVSPKCQSSKLISGISVNGALMIQTHKSSDIGEIGSFAAVQESGCQAIPRSKLFFFRTHRIRSAAAQAPTATASARTATPTCIPWGLCLPIEKGVGIRPAARNGMPTWQATRSCDQPGNASRLHQAGAKASNATQTPPASAAPMSHAGKAVPILKHRLDASVTPSVENPAMIGDR